MLGATAASGSIAVSSADFLVLDQLVAAGGTVVVISDQSITDDNKLEMEDRADTARLQELWDKVGLAADDAGKQTDMLAKNTEAEARRLAALYHEYFRSAVDTDGLSAEQLALRADQRADARAQLEAAFGPAALASYNQNLAAGDARAEYLAGLVKDSVLLKTQLRNEVEEALFNQTTSTLRTEVANIVAAEIVLTAGGDIGAYHYEATSISGYLDKVAAASPDVSLDAEERKLLWSSESTDRYLVKDDNGGLVLVSQYDGKPYASGATLPDGKQVDDLLADNTLNLRAGDMLVFKNEDLNVLISSPDGALSFKAGDNALLGTGLADLNASADQNLKVRAGLAGEELRLKADGDLLLTAVGQNFGDGSGEQTGLLAGDDNLLAAEASKGSIGTETWEMLIGEHGALRLRALRDIHVASLPAGDGYLYVEGVNADGSFNLTADHNLTLDQEVINIGAGSTLTAGNDLTLRGDQVSLGGAVLTAGGDVGVELTDASGDGTTRLSLADGLEVSDGVNPAPLLVTGSADPAVTDELDLSGLSGSGATEIDRADGGGYSNNGRVVNFDNLDSLKTGSGNDSLNLAGGSFRDIDLGGGENSVSASARADWTLGDSSLGVASGSAGIAAIANADVLNGSGQDSLAYNGRGAANWLVDADNSGTVNNLRFNGISSVDHRSAGGGSFDLKARMDNITLAAPQTLILYDGGYFHRLVFASGVNVFDIRYRHTPTRPGPGAGLAGDEAEEGSGSSAGSFLTDGGRAGLNLQAYLPGPVPYLDLILYSLPDSSAPDYSTLDLSVTMNAGYGSGNTTAAKEDAEIREASATEETRLKADSENETAREAQGAGAPATGMQDHSTPQEKDAEADSENETPEETEGDQ